MPIEVVQLRGKPVPKRFTKCNGCGADPFVMDELVRGKIQRCKRKFGFLWKQDYCAVICNNCRDIVGYESPDENWMGQNMRTPQAPLMRAPRSDLYYREDIQFVSASLVRNPEPDCVINQEGIVNDVEVDVGKPKKVKRVEEPFEPIDNEIFEGGFLIE
jgi:hypothetical protein